MKRGLSDKKRRSGVGRIGTCEYSPVVRASPAFVMPAVYPFPRREKRHVLSPRISSRHSSVPMSMSPISRVVFLPRYTPFLVGAHGSKDSRKSHTHESRLVRSCTALAVAQVRVTSSPRSFLSSERSQAGKMQRESPHRRRVHHLEYTHAALAAKSGPSLPLTSRQRKK